jgi:polyhydroxyalkanoate synthesis regulator phasin
MEKMTNVKAINYVLENCNVPSDVAEKLAKMKDQFVKKNTAERKPTANQVENAGLKTAILDFLADNKGAYTITDLMKSVSALADLSNQRVSALVRQLVEDGSVVRTEEKRKAYFSYNGEVAEEVSEEIADEE